MPSADVEEGQSRSAREASSSLRHRSALGGPEEEVERLFALRSSNRDARLQREKRAADRLQREQGLAAAWKRRAEAKASQLKQARQEQLQQACFKHSSRQVAISQLGIEPRAEPAWSNQPPLSRTVSLDVSTQADGAVSRHCDRKTSTRATHSFFPNSLENTAEEPLQRKPVQRRPSLDSVKSARKSRSPSPCSHPVLPGGDQSPRRSSQPAEPDPVATPRASVSAGLAAASAPCTPRRWEVTGPEVSLMPRKEMLRQRQQWILKNSDVVFYKQDMRAHFDKIQEAVEFTFLDSTRNKRPNWNLAKPVCIKETRHHATA